MDQDLEGMRLSQCFQQKKLGQRFVLDLWVDYEMTVLPRTGDLEASVHYGILAEQLTSGCRQKRSI